MEFNPFITNNYQYINTLIKNGEKTETETTKKTYSFNGKEYETPSIVRNYNEAKKQQCQHKLLAAYAGIGGLSVAGLLLSFPIIEYGPLCVAATVLGYIGVACCVVAGVSLHKGSKAWKAEMIAFQPYYDAILKERPKYEKLLKHLQATKAQKRNFVKRCASKLKACVK